MATTDCGVSAPPRPLVPRDRARPAALRPLTTGSYSPPAFTDASSGSRRLRLSVYTLPLAAALGVAGWGYLPGHRLAAGDPVPLLPRSLRPELWSSWSHQLSGGGSTSYPMSRAVESGLADLADSMGAGPRLVQLLAAGAAVVYAAAAVTFLARLFV